MLNSVPAAAHLYGVLACWSDGWCRDRSPEAAVVKQAVMLLFFIPVEFGQNVSDYKTMAPRLMPFSVVSLCSIAGHGGNTLIMRSYKEENSLAAALAHGLKKGRREAGSQFTVLMVFLLSRSSVR